MHIWRGRENKSPCRGWLDMGGRREGSSRNSQEPSRACPYLSGWILRGRWSLPTVGALSSWSEGQDEAGECRGCKGCGLLGSAAEADLCLEVWGPWQAERPSRDPIKQTRLS